MKSAIAAALLLAGLVTTCWWVSKSQEKAISPILEKIDSIDTLKEELNEEDRKNAIRVIQLAKEEFSNRNFVVEIGVPQKDIQKIEAYMEKTIIFLKTKEDALFFSHIKELSENLSILKNYGKINFKNIT